MHDLKKIRKDFEAFKKALELKIEQLIGVYRPTKRNIIVIDHYKKLGFKLKKKNVEKIVWQLSVKDYKKEQIPIELL